jgi:hypothetical protein
MPGLLKCASIGWPLGGAGQQGFGQNNFGRGEGEAGSYGLSWTGVRARLPVKQGVLCGECSLAVAAMSKQSEEGECCGREFAVSEGARFAEQRATGFLHVECALAVAFEGAGEASRREGRRPRQALGWPAVFCGNAGGR